MDIKTKAVLKKVISIFSINIIYDSKKFRAVMRDFCVPKIDINLLQEIMSTSAFKAFIFDTNNFNNYEKLKLLNELSSEFPIKKELLLEGIDAFLFGIGIIEAQKEDLALNEEENKLIASVIKQMLEGS